MKQLFRDYEVHQKMVQLFFSITFALSCTLFELIIFEILGVLEPRQVFASEQICFALFCSFQINILFLTCFR